MTDGPRIGSLCTGYGGLDEAVRAVFGGELTWWSDIEPGPIAVSERLHPGVPNLGDLKLVDWSAVAPVEILTAGYPCQPFSNAGKRLGTEDPRHIWPWIADAVGVLRPRVIVLENVAAHLRRGFDVVLADLASLGYDAAWTVVRASDVGAPHQRRRLYVVATPRDASVFGWDFQSACATSEPEGAFGGSDRLAAPNTASVRRDERRAEPTGVIGGSDSAFGGSVDWGDYGPAVRRWEKLVGRQAPEPTTTGRGGVRVLNPALVEWMMGLQDGLVTDTPGLSRPKQLRLLGNGVVPQQAEYAIRSLLPAFGEE